jgi:hypothetical protein
MPDQPKRTRADAARENGKLGGAPKKTANELVCTCPGGPRTPGQHNRNCPGWMRDYRAGLRRPRGRPRKAVSPAP